MSILANGNILIAGEFDETAALLDTKSSLYANGNYFIDGELDEVSITNFDNQTLTWTFTGTNTTMAAAVSCMNITATGNYTGGTYNITVSDNNNAITGGVNGGAGGAGSDYWGGGGGAIGGVNGTAAVTTASAGVGAVAADVSGLFSIITNLGYSTSTFGKGGNGSKSSGGTGGSGTFPGGGGGGGGYNLSGTGPGGVSANAAVVISRITNGITYNTLISQTTGNGSLILPVGTTYLKAWAIGHGRNGGAGSGGQGFSYGGAGGGSGGVAYFQLGETSKFTGYIPTRGTVSKQYSNGSLRIAGTLDEASLFGGQVITINYTPVDNAEGWTNNTVVTFKDATLIGGGGGGNHRYTSGSTRDFYYANGVLRLGDNRIAGNATVTTTLTTITDYGTANGGVGGLSSSTGSGRSNPGAGIGNLGNILSGSTTQEAFGAFSDTSGILSVAAALGYDITSAKVSYGDGGNGALTATNSGYSGYPAPNFGGGGGGGEVTDAQNPAGVGNTGGPGCVILQYRKMGDSNTYNQLFSMNNGNTTYTIPYGTNYFKIWALGQGAQGITMSHSNTSANNGSGTYLRSCGGGAGGLAWGAFVYDTNHGLP
jgi:hypothetical protein